MGGNTYKEVKSQLPGAHNIVVSSSISSAQGAELCLDISCALKKAASYGNDIFIIGGANIFEQTIGMANRMCLSYINKSYDGDKFFPKFSMEEWKIKSKQDFPQFEYVVYVRKKSTPKN